MNFESSDNVSFVVDMPTKDILHKLGHSFLDYWDFSRECDLGNIWLFKREDDYRGLIIEIGEHPDDNSKSIIATVAYEVQHDWIITSESAERTRDYVIEDIEKRIGVRRGTISKHKFEADNIVSNLASETVKGLARPRIEVTWGILRKLSMSYKAMLAVTIASLLILTIVFVNYNQLGIISSSTYVEVTVALIIALFVEIGFPLREEVAKKKREELEF